MLRVARDHPYKDDAPTVGNLSPEAERLEWNLNHHHVAVASEFSGGMPNRVKGIVWPAAFCKESILLDTVRIRIKKVGVALVVKCVQPYADLIVIVNQLPAQ